MPSAISRQKEDWEDLAELDPFWAILSRSEHRYGQWPLDAFFETGREEIAELLSVARKLEKPKGWNSALDFGCGVGRLTRALAPHFTQCWGVDISERMVEKARELNAHTGNCTFAVNRGPGLEIFPDGRFDLIYTNIVLQHLPSAEAIEFFVREFVRVLKPNGLLAFKLINHVPFPYSLEPRRRLYSALRRVGVSHRFLYRRLDLYPIRSTAIPDPRVRDLLGSLDASLLEVDSVTLDDTGVRTSVYYVTREC